MEKSGKKMIANLDYNDNEFPVSEKKFQLIKIKLKNNISINVFYFFGCENNHGYIFYLSKGNFKNHTELLLIVIINRIMFTSKTLIDLCIIKYMIKNKNPHGNIVDSKWWLTTLCLDQRFMYDKIKHQRQKKALLLTTL